MPFNLPLLPAPLRSRIIVVDCGARHVAWGRFMRGGGGRLVLERWAFATHEAGSHPDASWADHTGRALAALVAREEPGGACRLALAGHHTLVKFVRLPVAGKNERAGMIDFEARQSIPLPLEQVVWNHLPVVDNGSEMKFMLAAVKRDLAGAITGAAEAAGLRLSQMVPSGLTLLSAFRYSHPGECNDVLVVEVGARSTHLVFMEREGFFIRTFSLGGDFVTQAAADELQVDFTTAEALKIEVLSGRPGSAVEVLQYDAVRRACARFAERLHLEIVRSTIRYRCHSGAAQPSAVYLCGGGSLIPELPLLLAEQLALRVVRFDPLRKVELAPSAREGSASSGPMLAGLIGLGTSLVDGRWPGLNLLPPAMVKAQAARRRQPVLIGAALLATLAPLPVVWAEQRVARATEAASAAVERRLIPLRAIAARNGHNLVQMREIQRRIDGTRRILEAKSNWAAFFNDLQARLAMTGDVWLERLQVVPPVDDGGRAPAGPVPAAARLILSGRMLDRSMITAKVGAGSYSRVADLLQLLRHSPFVAAVENERFNGREADILHFDATLVMHAAKLF